MLHTGCMAHEAAGVRLTRTIFRRGQIVMYGRVEHETEPTFAMRALVWDLLSTLQESGADGKLLSCAARRS